jgi:hypothetical protein
MKMIRVLPLFLATVALLAQPESKTAVGAQGLKYGVWQQELPEMGKVTTGVLTAGKDSYLFMPPANWVVESDGAWGVRLVGGADRGSIFIRLLPETGSEMASLTGEGLRTKALRRFPGGRILSEVTCHAEGGSGQAFDLDWCDSQGARFTARLAHVEVGKRAFEFLLLAPSRQFNVDLGTFTALLTSFQSSASLAGT